MITIIACAGGCVANHAQYTYEFVLLQTKGLTEHFNPTLFDQCLCQILYDDHTDWNEKIATTLSSYREATKSILHILCSSSMK